MRGKKTDSKVKAKIIEEKINNPDSSSRDIEKETGIPHETISKVLRDDLAQVCTQSEHIAEIIDSNKRIMSIGKKLIENYLPALEINRHDDLKKISDIVESSFKQNQLIEGKATENIKVDVNIDDLTVEESLEFIKSKLG